MKVKCVLPDGAEKCDACAQAVRPCTFLQEGKKREKPATKKYVRSLSS